MRIDCDCGKKLNLADRYAGKKVRCPECKGVIQVPDESIAEAAVATSVKSKKRVRPESEVDEDDRPRARKRFKKRATFLSQYGLYLGIGSGVLAIAAIVVTVTVLRRTPESEKESKVADNTNDRKPGVPQVIPPKKDGIPSNVDGGPRDVDKPKPIPVLPDNPQPMAIPVSVQQISDEFAANNVGTKKKYENKILVLEGIVEWAPTPEESPVQTIMLQVPGNDARDANSRWSAHSSMKPSTARVPLVKGQKVTIKGLCYAVALDFAPNKFDLTLEASEFVSVGPDPSEKVSAAQLTQAFATDKAAAEKTYLKKSVVVEGTVVKINATLNLFFLAGHDEKAGKPSRVMCSFPGIRKQMFSSIQVGQVVKVLGVVDKYGANYLNSETPMATNPGNPTVEMSANGLLSK